MDPRMIAGPVGAALGPATGLVDRLTTSPGRSRVSATPPPLRAAGLAYHSVGQGPEVLLIHGLGSSRAAFNPIVDDLARDHRVIVVDLPGHGDSEPLLVGEPLTPRAQAFAVGEFLDALGIERAHTVGNSMGGWVALEMAADDRALSVTALCPAGLWQPLHGRSPVIDFNRSAAKALGLLGEWLLAIAPLRELAMASALQRPYRVDWAQARATLGALRAATGYDEAHEGMLEIAFDRGHQIPAEIPVTLAFGDDDPLLPARTSQRHDLAPAHARWEILDRVGHTPMWEVPETTAAMVRRSVAAAG